LEIELLTAALNAGLETLLEYLSAHVLTCLVPAFFIAGAIAALLDKETVLKYFGRDASKWLCYPVAATSGTILAVCSCTILPMFAGIERRGAGIGPATAFLFSGPAINLLAIILTARVLGLDLGIARGLSAITMAVVIGLIMAAVFDRGDRKCEAVSMSAPVPPQEQTRYRPGYLNLVFLSLLVAILLVATTSLVGLLPKATIVAVLGLSVAYIMRSFYTQEEKAAFLGETWWLTRKIFPLLVAGTFITGVIGYFLPVEIIRSIFGSNGFLACFTASVIGSLLYMPTLLEVPIVGTLFGYSAGITAPGPALALLLSGPSLSLPNMIVIWRVMGGKKTTVYVMLVVLVSTAVGMIYGALMG